MYIHCTAVKHIPITRTFLAQFYVHLNKIEGEGMKAKQMSKL